MVDKPTKIKMRPFLPMFRCGYSVVIWTDLSHEKRRRGKMYKFEKFLLYNEREREREREREYQNSHRKKP
jgi:hypothetical protein